MVWQEVERLSQGAQRVAAMLPQLENASLASFEQAGQGPGDRAGARRQGRANQNHTGCVECQLTLRALN